MDELSGGKALEKQRGREISMPDRCGRLGSNYRFGVIGNPETGGLDHVEVVCPITERDGILRPRAEGSGGLQQRRPLGGAAEDRLADFAGQRGAVIDKCIALMRGKAGQLSNARGEESEAATQIRLMISERTFHKLPIPFEKFL